MIADKIAVEALEAIEQVLAAWDEPHRGDLDMARDSMFDPIERARAFLAAADAALRAAGQATRPHRDPALYRRLFKG